MFDPFITFLLNNSNFLKKKNLKVYEWHLKLYLTELMIKQAKYISKTCIERESQSTFKNLNAVEICLTQITFAVTQNTLATPWQPLNH